MVAIHNMITIMIGDVVEDGALVEVDVVMDQPVVEVLKILRNHHQV